MRAAILAILAAATLAVAAPASAQAVKHLQNSNPGGIANGVWVREDLEHDLGTHVLVELRASA